MRRRRQLPITARTAPERQLLLFWTISILIWLRAFAIQRYLVPIEALTGVVMLIGLRHLVNDRMKRVVSLGVIAVALVLVTRAPDYGNIPFRSRMISSSELRPLYKAHALYVMTGGEPTAYVVPALPHDVRFVRIDGNMPLDPSQGLGKRVAEIIDRHPGPILTLTAGPLTDSSRDALARYGLTPTVRCVEAAGSGQKLWSCETTRKRAA